MSHRFWNIYDSMSCSEYIATRLDTYKDDASECRLCRRCNGCGSLPGLQHPVCWSACVRLAGGRSKLDRLLALSGVHLRTAKEPWTSMPQADKKLLWDALHAICEERLGDPLDFPIRPELWYPSFTRAVGACPPPCEQGPHTSHLYRHPQRSAARARANTGDLFLHRLMLQTARRRCLLLTCAMPSMACWRQAARLRRCWST